MPDQNKITALYYRLSQEDERAGESNSISHQREILTRYVEDKGFGNIREFIDDGYSGVTFDRPGFQEMLKLVEADKIGVIVTKDLSRLGRNYLEVGNYTEFVFPRHNVRYIAINDCCDTLFPDENEFAPLKNLFNEWFARDTSKKIRAVFKAKGENGKRVGTTVPYGYRRDPDRQDECHLLVNEDTAPVVRRIFALCADGKGPCAIAAILRDEQIPKPSEYRFRTEGAYGFKTDKEDPYGWTGPTVASILDNEVYLGNTVNFRTEVISFKDKRVRERPQNEWVRIENTHEALIDPETWEIVRRVREGKRRPNKTGEISKYSGLIFCADCGNKHYYRRPSAVEPEKSTFVCSRYRKHLGEELCTPHSIREVVLDELVLEEINRTLYYARTKTQEFAAYINRKSSSQTRKELNARTAEQIQAQKRVTELKALFKRLYEDNVLGRISDEQFRMLSAEYTDEQKSLEARLSELEKEIEALRENVTNVQRFLDTAKKYTDIKELTPEILRTFIQKIVIHEREQKHTKNAPQQIDIHFRYLGMLEGMDEPESEKTASA